MALGKAGLHDVGGGDGGQPPKSFHGAAVAGQRQPEVSASDDPGQPMPRVVVHGVIAHGLPLIHHRPVVTDAHRLRGGVPASAEVMPGSGNRMQPKQPC